jgi:hypothetical protein
MLLFCSIFESTCNCFTAPIFDAAVNNSTAPFLVNLTCLGVHARPQAKIHCIRWHTYESHLYARINAHKNGSIFESAFKCWELEQSMDAIMLYWYRGAALIRNSPPPLGLPQGPRHNPPQGSSCRVLRGRYFLWARYPCTTHQFKEQHLTFKILTFDLAWRDTRTVLNLRTYFAELWSGSEEGSYSRLIDFDITQC